jgi:hypothetical protein
VYCCNVVEARSNRQSQASLFALHACRQRVEVADARAALSEERIAASKAATDAALMVATTAAHGTIGLDTPTAWGPATAAKRPFPAGRVWPSASVPHSVSSGAVGAAAAAARRCNSSMGGASSKAGRKLRRIVDKLQHDQGRGKRVSRQCWKLDQPYKPLVVCWPRCSWLPELYICVPRLACTNMRISLPPVCAEQRCSCLAAGVKCSSVTAGLLDTAAQHLASELHQRKHPQPQSSTKHYAGATYGQLGSSCTGQPHPCGAIPL